MVRTVQMLSLLTFVVSLGIYLVSTHAGNPHIIFIVADDLGWNDVGWHNPKVITPNLDNLAKNGMTLENYYVLPVCSPSRSAFMTGYYPFHIGMQHYVIEPMQPTGLPLHLQTLPDRLKQLGYSTHMVGKWHLGYCKWDYTPTYRGFDSFFGFHGGMNDHFSHHRSSWSQYPSSSGLDFWFNRTVVRNQGGVYSAFSHAKRAVDVISNHDISNPLFLYVAFQNVHSPLQTPQEYIDMYAEVKDKKRRVYLAMVTALDVAVGQILETLERKGMMNDTVIAFTSDNGGPVQSGGNNWPLRGSKHSFFEGGTRVVGLVHGDMFRSKTAYGGLMHAVDWLPTFVEAAGGSVSKVLDGKSQWKGLLGMTFSARDELIYNVDEIDARAALRIGNFKLIVGNPLSAFFPAQGGWYPPPEGMMSQLSDNNLNWKQQESQVKAWWCFWCTSPTNHVLMSQLPTTPLRLKRPLFGFNVTVQLFDLDSDPTEHNDLSNQRPEIVDRLYQRLLEYVKTVAPSRFPPETQMADPVYHNGTWTPGWCP